MPNEPSEGSGSLPQGIFFGLVVIAVLLAVVLAVASTGFGPFVREFTKGAVRGILQAVFEHHL